MMREERDRWRSISGRTLPNAPAMVKEITSLDVTTAAAVVKLASKPLAIVPTAKWVLKLAMQYHLPNWRRAIDASMQSGRAIQIIKEQN